MNNLNYVNHIFQNLHNVLILNNEQTLFRELHKFNNEQENLIQLP